MGRNEDGPIKQQQYQTHEARDMHIGWLNDLGRDGMGF